MVAPHNLVNGVSKRNPNPNTERASQVKWEKSKQGRRERAEAIKSRPGPQDRVELVHWENHGHLRERVKAGVLSPSEAISIVRADINGSQKFIEWAQRKS